MTGRQQFSGTVTAWSNSLLNRTMALLSSSHFYPRFKSYIRSLWLIAVFAGVVIFALRHRSEVEGLLRNMSVGLFILSIVGTGVGKVLVAQQMRMSLSLRGHSLDWTTILRLYSYPDIAKYIPGGIWGIVSRIAMYRDHMIPTKTIVRSFSIEHVWLIGAAFALGLAFYVPNSGFLPASTGPVGGIVLSILIFLIWIGGIVVTCRILTGRCPSIKTISTLFSLQFMIWSTLSASFAILCPTENMSLSLLLSVAGAFSIGFSIGFLSFFAPAGIGVREVIIISMLAPFYPAATIMTVAIANRICWLIADLCFSACVYLWSTRSNAIR